MSINENINIINLAETIAVQRHKENEYNKLVKLVDNLITNDFNSLVQLLYKVDVNEEKLKQTLQHRSDENTAVLITDLLLLRLKQKSETRFNTKNNKENIPDDEKW